MYQTLRHLIFYHGLTHPGERRNLIPAHSSDLVPSKGRGEGTEALVKVTIQGPSSQKDLELITGLKYTSSPPTPYHHNTKGHLQFLLPRTSCAPFYKKLQVIQKKEKHHLKRLNEQQNGNPNTGN